jgi:copper chaperone CopZ
MTSIKNEEVDASSSELASGSSCDDGVAVCYLCLDGGLDDADQPLRRDCACRGTDAGFVHLACFTKYAATKSEQSRGMQEFVTPWHICPSCHQEYQNELAIHIANEFVSFVRRQYPHNTPRQVETLYVKLGVLMGMFGRLQPRQKREVGVTANVLLSLIGRMKNDASLPRRYSWFEAIVHNAHGLIAFDEGTDESARRAVTHFEKYLKVCEAIGNVEGIATAKANIALAKSKYEGDNNNEEVLKACQELYELHVAELGEEDYLTIRDGKTYAEILQKANRRDEARELLTKLLATSKQVLGTNHNTTKNIELSLK